MLPPNSHAEVLILSIWTWDTACPVSKQRMLQPSSHHITMAPMVSHKETQNRNRMPTIKQSVIASTPRMHPEETQGAKA